eukprot:TRINITY_DN64843_c0_g1_i1.p1 TRINITY_DN64843_c0_g1~~TRINITY_DN64843_c0_g1_i1.p1  ORF type:complete len:252 (-),score=49.71 TRINITY_DN64843_c0_g1_i1:231-956(-)
MAGVPPRFARRALPLSILKQRAERERQLVEHNARVAQRLNESRLRVRGVPLDFGVLGSEAKAQAQTRTQEGLENAPARLAQSFVASNSLAPLAAEPCANERQEIADASSAASTPRGGATTPVAAIASAISAASKAEAGASAFVLEFRLERPEAGEALLASGGGQVVAALRAHCGRFGPVAGITASDTPGVVHVTFKNLPGLRRSLKAHTQPRFVEGVGTVLQAGKASESRPARRPPQSKRG